MQKPEEWEGEPGVEFGSPWHQKYLSAALSMGLVLREALAFGLGPM